MRGGGQRPFGTFLKIHPLWYGFSSLRSTCKSGSIEWYLVWIDIHRQYYCYCIASFKDFVCPLQGALTDSWHEQCTQAMLWSGGLSHFSVEKRFCVGNCVRQLWPEVGNESGSSLHTAVFQPSFHFVQETHRQIQNKLMGTETEKNTQRVREHKLSKIRYVWSTSTSTFHWCNSWRCFFLPQNDAMSIVFRHS